MYGLLDQNGVAQLPTVETQDGLEFEAIAIATVQRYFEGFNRGDYDGVAALFAETGRLVPPFEAAVEGPEAIATYLVNEADGMVVESLEITPLGWDGDQFSLKAAGKVTAIVFQVNVAWQFRLNGQGQIEQVQVKLLASLEDLLKVRPH